MHLRLASPRSTLPLLLLLPSVLGGCSSDSADDGVSSAGSGAAFVAGGSGGSIPGGPGGATVGGAASGASSGGRSGASSGGALSGGTSSGGRSGASSGGALSAGAPSGGAPSAGAPSGGSGGGAGAASGAAGAPGGAGSGGGGKVSGVEDPSADCAVGTLPTFASLTANDKLPDPFKKLDGTAITSKSEWRCRRAEILKLGYEFIYGEKPKTPASAVSGTVSNSSVSVSVSDGGKSGSFSATISLPTTGQAPYPALITYSGVAAGLTNEMRNRGVAVINYNPLNVATEAASAAGAFYTIYGSNHAAGRLTAWAWGVSRILDVLEKNPGTIDPTKIAVTGCSRYGKGAFVAGVLDGRVALTIPVESGIGGTPALRLIEQLDSYSGSEWPYHAISYVAWFSPSKLGQFTNANNANGDNTNKLPVDMHEMMALIAPRGLYIVDNPSTNYNGLDRNSAYATAAVGAKIFEALGAKDSFTYAGASGNHCDWRQGYTAPLVANIQKFLLGDASAATGTFTTDLGGTKPNPDSLVDYTLPTLSGTL